MKKTKIIALIYSNIVIWLALSFYVSTVFDAGASQDKHEGAIPVRGTAETREDIGAEETARICSDIFIVCGDGGEYTDEQLMTALAAAPPLRT